MTSILVWTECDPALANALKSFSEKLGAHSAQSRKYSIFSLIKNEIDPVWQSFIQRYELTTNSILENAWLELQSSYLFSKEIIDINQHGNIIESNIASESKQFKKINIEKCDSLAYLSKQYGFDSLEKFMPFVVRFSSTSARVNEHNATFVESINSLR